MSSYFSRLIQQTEIAVGMVQPKAAIARDEVTAFEPIEEIQAIESEVAPPENGELERLGNPQEERFQSIGRSEEAQNAEILIFPHFSNQDAANRNDSPLPQSTRRASSGESPQPKPLEHPIELSSANILPSDEADTGLNVDRPTANSKNILESPTHAQTNAIQKTPHSPETAFPKQGAQKNTARSHERETSGGLLGAQMGGELTAISKAISKENNPLPTRQVNLQKVNQKVSLQTVREWVAGGENSKQNPEPSQLSETQPQNSQNWVADTENSTLNANPLQFPQSQETPNFKLSIGTIRLTVEAPQADVPKPPLPPMKPQQTVKPVHPTSRLNRHYLKP